tara:strand:+ start:1354 stop:1818 length:465 start_codon:yes stop_codon:yes gene_type:complete
MARITVEDCLKKIDSQYDLVLLAKERTSQLNAGEQPLVDKDNDKNTVISLREIGEGKVSVKTLEDSAINKLRKQQEESADVNQDLDDETEDDFDKIYKGEISKSGTAILPSKRLRRIPEKITSAISEKKNETNNEDEVLEKEETNQETVEKKSE